MLCRRWRSGRLSNRRRRRRSLGGQGITMRCRVKCPLRAAAIAPAPEVRARGHGRRRRFPLLQPKPRRLGGHGQSGHAEAGAHTRPGPRLRRRRDAPATARARSRQGAAARDRCLPGGRERQRPRRPAGRPHQSNTATSFCSPALTTIPTTLPPARSTTAPASSSSSKPPGPLPQPTRPPDAAPRRRLRFCFFAAEEIGLLGSWSYVSRHAAELSRLRFMLNVDDIGRSDPGAESLHLVGCPELVPHFAAHAQAMHYPLTVHERLSTSSDHFPFVMHGIPAGTVENEASAGERQRSCGPRLGPHHRRYRRQSAPRDRPVGCRSHRASAAAPSRRPALARPPTPTRSRRSRIRRQRPPRRASPIRPLAPTLVRQRQQRMTGTWARYHDLPLDENRAACYYIYTLIFDLRHMATEAMVWSPRQ